MRRALASKYDGECFDARPIVGFERTLQILLRDLDLAGNEFLQRYRRPYHIVDIQVDRGPIFFLDLLEPGRNVRLTVFGQEPEAGSRTGDLGVNVRLFHLAPSFAKRLLQQPSVDLSRKNFVPMPHHALFRQHGNRNRLTIDRRRHTRHLLSQLRIVVDVDNLGLVLKLPEELRGHCAQFVVANLIRQTLFSILAITLVDVGRRNMPFALKNNVTVIDLNDVRHFAFFQTESGGLELRHTHVSANGGNNAHQRRTGVLGILLRQTTELLRIRFRLLKNFLGFLPGRDGNQPHAYLGTKLGLERLTDLLR